MNAISPCYETLRPATPAFHRTGIPTPIGKRARLALILVLAFGLLLGHCAPSSALGDGEYLPSGGAATSVVSAEPESAARTRIIILTTVLPANDNDPKEIAAFGQLYAFNPRVIFINQEEPTNLSFWNLQSDENHDFMLTDPLGRVLMKLSLPELKKTDVTLTFHQQGLYSFYCTMHQPEMSGQIMVLPRLPPLVQARRPQAQLQRPPQASYQRAP